MDANKTYTCSIVTDNGIVFKNGEGQTTLTASVMDAGTDLTDTLTITWKKDGVELETGKSVTVQAADIEGKAVYRFEAQDAGGILRGVCEVTVSIVSDGEKGDKGDPGEDGTSPTVTVNADTSLTITDQNGTQTTPVLKGEDGDSGEDGQMLYAVCQTGESVAAKEATLEEGGLVLKPGTAVAVRFDSANTASSPTLNVDGTGAKAIYAQGTRYVYWAAGATVTFTYDGTNWRAASEPVYSNEAIIGNPGGFNVHILGDIIEMRVGITVLSSFAASEIHLGQDAGAMISLCGNQAFLMTDLSGRTVICCEEGIDVTTKQPSASGYVNAERLRVNSGGVFATPGDYSGELGRVLTTRDELFSVTEVTLSLGTIASNNTGSATKALSRSGYTPVCVVGYRFTGTGGSGSVVIELYVSGTNLKATVRKITTGSTSGLSLIASILWKKN